MNFKLPTRALCVLAIALLTAACGEDIMQPDGEGVTGTWTFTVDVTTALGGCLGEDDDETNPPGVATVGIVQTGNMVVARSGWFADFGVHEFTGTRTGDQISISGSYQEEGELLEATYYLTVSSDENSMTGTEEWDWDSQCEGSESDVTATRN